jgi:hypothetical protein
MAALIDATAVGSLVIAVAAKGRAARNAPSPNVDTATAAHTSLSRRRAAFGSSADPVIAVSTVRLIGQ